MKALSLKLVLAVAVSSLILSCAQKPPQKDIHFEIPEEALKHTQLPCCDPHPYIYGCDGNRRWQSNGCSRTYIGTCTDFDRQ